MFAAGLGALFVGAVLAISGGSLLALSGAGLAAAGLYAVAVAAWGFSGRALRASAAGFGLIAVLTLGAARQVLFGTAECAQDACSPDDIGWFGRHALPWLADSFWNVTFAIVALFGLAVVVGIATTRRSRPRRRTTAVDLARDTAAILASRGDDAARSPARVEPEAPEMLPAEPVATGTGRSSG